MELFKLEEQDTDWIPPSETVCVACDRNKELMYLCINCNEVMCSECWKEKHFGLSRLHCVRLYLGKGKYGLPAPPPVMPEFKDKVHTGDHSCALSMQTVQLLNEREGKLNVSVEFCNISTHKLRQLAAYGYIPTSSVRMEKAVSKQMAINFGNFFDNANVSAGDYQRS